MSNGSLKRVVVRIPNTSFRVVIDKSRSKRLASANKNFASDSNVLFLLSVLYQAKRRVCRVEGIHQNQMMGLGTDITRAQKRASADLPFDRQKVILIVWITVLGIWTSRSLDRFELREIDRRIGVGR